MTHVAAGHEISLGATGPPLIEHTADSFDSFWDRLYSWGGEWMWEQVQLYAPLACIAQAFCDVTAICVTDGSYQKHVNPTLSGAGCWLIYCLGSDQILVTGSFVEDHVRAGSYRGEVLGMLAIHLFSLAIKNHFSLDSTSFGKVCCDNNGAIYRSQQWKKRIAPGVANADLLRVFHSLHHRLGGIFRYEHVYGHQDQFLRWDDLPLVAKLNCWCDLLAKEAVLRNWCTLQQQTRQLLPHESAAVRRRCEADF